MKKIIKYNEFFDTEDIKIEHEIDIISNKLTKSSIIKNFQEQSPFQSLFATLTYKFAFFQEATKSNPYAFLTETNSKLFFINFVNEQAKIAIGINFTTDKKYDLHIIYIPNGIDMEKTTNWIIVNGELLDLRRDKIVDQEFKNVDVNDIIKKIDNVLIPIMKEFGFNTLLNMYKSPYDIDKN